MLRYSNLSTLTIRKTLHILIYSFKTEISGQLVSTSFKIKIAANKVRHPYTEEAKTLFLKWNPVQSWLSHAGFDSLNESGDGNFMDHFCFFFNNINFISHENLCYTEP